jgi:hypothetical protein
MPSARGPRPSGRSRSAATRAARIRLRDGPWPALQTAGTVHTAAAVRARLRRRHDVGCCRAAHRIRSVTARHSGADQAEVPIGQPPTYTNLAPATAHARTGCSATRWRRRSAAPQRQPPRGSDKTDKLSVHPRDEGTEQSEVAGQHLDCRRADRWFAGGAGRQRLGEVRPDQRHGAAAAGLQRDVPQRMGLTGGPAGRCGRFPGLVAPLLQPGPSPSPRGWPRPDGACQGATPLTACRRQRRPAPARRRRGAGRREAAVRVGHHDGGHVPAAHALEQAGQLLAGPDGGRALLHDSLNGAPPAAVSASPRSWPATTRSALTTMKCPSRPAESWPRCRRSGARPPASRPCRGVATPEQTPVL